MIIGFLGIIFSSIPLILWFLKHQNIVIDNENLIPHSILMISLCIVSLGLFFISLFDWIKIKKEVEGYLKKAKLGNNVIPNFIIANYRKMHIRSIIINWVAFPLYIYWCYDHCYSLWIIRSNPTKNFWFFNFRYDD